jgi:SAM-dependent methyltransferase
MDKKKQTIQTYNTSAKKLSDYYRSVGPRVSEIENIFSRIHTVNPFIVEIGCGSGREAKEILKRTDAYLGIDISESMIALAKNNVPDATFIVADIETTVLPESVDAVFAFASLLHSDKETLGLIFKKIYEALTPGGLFLYTLKMAKEKVYTEKTIKDAFGTRTYYFYTPEILRTLCVGLFLVVFEEVAEAQGNTWITMIVQKPHV